MKTLQRLLRTLLPLMMVLGLVVALAGCAQPTPEPTEAPAEEEEATEPPAEEEEEQEEEMAEEVFKLGILGPFSGPSARTGDEFEGSVNIAFSDIDWQIGPYKIEPIWIDSESDPAKASQAYEQAIVQHDIQAGLLNWHSSVAVACMEVTAKHKIPHFYGFGATETVNETFNSDPEKYGYWALKGWPTPEKLSIAYVQALEDAIASGAWSPEAKTVALFGEDTDWGRSWAGGIKPQFVDAGWEIVAEEYFALDATDMVPLLNKFKQQNPAVVAGTGTGLPAVSGFIKQADEVGLESLIIMDGLGWFGEWYELTGDSSNYVLDQIPGWATEAGKEYAERFEAENGFAPSPSAGGLSYDGVGIFISAAQDAYEMYGELTSETLYKFIQEQIWTGEWTYTDGIVMEEYAYPAEVAPDPVGGKGKFIFPVLQYFDGEGKIIFPPEWAEQGLQPKQ